MSTRCTILTAQTADGQEHGATVHIYEDCGEVGDPVYFDFTVRPESIRVDGCTAEVRVPAALWQEIRQRLQAPDEWKIVTVGFTREERAQVEAAAKARGISANAWARQVLVAASRVATSAEKGDKEPS